MQISSSPSHRKSTDHYQHYQFYPLRVAHIFLPRLKEGVAAKRVSLPFMERYIAIRAFLRNGSTFRELYLRSG
jgi:hypothetical protein